MKSNWESALMKLVLSAVSLAVVVAIPLWADEAVQSEGLLPVPDYSGALAKRSHLTGDWGGVRRSWADRGVTLDFE